MRERRVSARSWRALGRSFRVGAWGLVDQGLVSGVNFFTVVLLARELTPVDFGYFVLAFTVLQTATTLQSALVTRPHNVLGAVRDRGGYADYSMTTAVEQAVFAGALGLLALVAAGIGAAAGFREVALLLVLCPALLTWQLQEFGRRVLYTENRLAAALTADAVGYGSQVVALVVLWRLDRLTATSALAAVAATFVPAIALEAWQLRSSLTGRFDRAALAANWRFGKWLAAAEVGYWFSSNFYFYLAAAVVGATASAVLKAGQTLLGPISVFLAFFVAYLPIGFARSLHGSGSLVASLRRSYAPIMAIVLPYCVAMSVFARPLLRTVYGAEYEGYASVVRLFALYYVLLAVSSPIVAALAATRRSRDIFVANAASGVVSLAIGWALLEALGPSGGVVGMIVTWLVAMAVYAWAFRSASAGPALEARARSGTRAPAG
jgi:O-antigen/teichoic acid export membrane protein